MDECSTMLPSDIHDMSIFWFSDVELYYVLGQSQEFWILMVRIL